jgi:nitrogen regulatory protein PII-like uncharacterized protein
MPALVKIADERVAKIIEERKQPAVVIESITEEEDVPDAPQ